MNRPPQFLLSLLAVLIGVSLFPSIASALPTELLRYHGDGSSATGAALANAPQCDVNGDGLDDAVVGAWFWDKAPLSNIGAAYVIFGDEAARGGSLNNPASAGAVRIDGPSVANAFVGFAVGCLGDVNGDGFDDVGISHYTAQKAYVIFGAENFTAVDLGLLGSRGFEVRGDSSSGNVGYSLAPVGDLNGDGRDEFGVAEVVADTQGRTNNGRIWVISGQNDIADVDLTNPAAGQIQLAVDGAYSEERLGVLSEVGDVNGDGKDDFLVGSYTSVPWGASVVVPGAAAVIWGGTTGTVDLADLGADGFRIFGPLRGRDRIGISVSGAGDVNDDGKADLLIGADGVFNAATGNRNGSAFVVFGSASTDTVYTAAPADDTIAAGPTDISVFTCDDDPGTGACASPEDVNPRGYRIVGVANNDSTGYSVAGIGDVSGDGIPDFAIGAYGYDPVNPANPPATMSGAGAVWVIHGKTGTATQQLADLTAAEGYRIDGLAAGDRMGRQVGSFGDFDGNGVNDLFAGGDFAGRPLPPGTPLSQAGEVIIGLNGALATESELEIAPAEALTLGQELELTARATRLAGEAAEVEAGSFAFTVDGAPIAGCGAVPADPSGATCEVEPTVRGEHVFAVEYSGVDGIHLGSEAEADPVFLSDTTETGLGASADEVTIGRQVTLTATVQPDHGGSPATEGTVAFTVADQPLAGCGSVPVVDGEATCETSFETVGERQVAAAFSGSSDLGASSASPVTLTVLAAPVATVGISRAPGGAVQYGQQVTVTAEVLAGGQPVGEGTVEFLADGQPIAGCDAVPVAGGEAECVTGFGQRGRLSLSADYESGTISIVGASSASDQLDVVDGSSLALAADRTSVRVGEPVKVTSTVTATNGGAVDEGLVDLSSPGCDGCGEAQVTGGQAVHDLVFAEPGTYVVNGSFAAATWLEDSAAAPLTIKVTKVPNCPAVRPTVNRPRFGKRGRVLNLRIASSSAAKVNLAPTIRFRRNGRVSSISLAGKSVQTGRAKTVGFRLTARQARRLPRRVAVTVKLRAKPAAGGCVASFGPQIGRSFGQVATGRAR